MLLFPAIDMRAGKCVRLTEGRFDQETVFWEDPAEAAAHWCAQGAEWLHLVDLDGALAGSPQNLATVRRILACVKVPAQLGGGIRSLATIEDLLANGVQRVILGSVAVRNPELVREACRKYGDRIVAGIDAKQGIAAVEGWGISGGVPAGELARRMAAAGVSRIIYTDISRDGTLQGVNLAACLAVANASGLPVIASGGVNGLADVRAAAAQAAGKIEGLIIGKALYTGALDLGEALIAARQGA